MRRMTRFILMCIVIFGGGGVSLAGQDAAPPAEGPELSAEEQEIIANLDLLDSLELLEEDLGFLEDYEGVEQPQSTGEDP